MILRILKAELRVLIAADHLVSWSTTIHVMHAWSSCLSHRSIANARSHSVHATASDSIAHGTDEARVSARLRLQLVPTRGQPLRVGETLLPRLRCSPLLCTLRLSGQKSSAAPCAAAARRRRANPARRRSPGRRRTAAHDAAKREKTHTKEREREWETGSLGEDAMSSLRGPELPLPKTETSTLQRPCVASRRVRCTAPASRRRIVAVASLLADS